MKLFEAIFDLIINKKEKLILKDDQIYAITTEKETFLYHNFEYNKYGYCAEQHHPLREEIEEWLSWIILNNDPRANLLAEYLNKNFSSKENPISRNTLKKTLKNDHPEIVRRIKLYSKEEIENAALQIIIEELRKGDIGLGRGDKERYEDLKFEKKKFIYEAGDTLCSVPEQTETFKQEKDFKKFLIKKHWVETKNGKITGKGNPTLFIPYWLKKRGVGSLREYLFRLDSSQPPS